VSVVERFVPDASVIFQQDQTFGQPEWPDFLIRIVMAVINLAARYLRIDPLRDQDEALRVAAFVSLAVIGQARPEIDPSAAIIEGHEIHVVGFDDRERLFREMIGAKCSEEVPAPAVEDFGPGPFGQVNDHPAPNWHVPLPIHRLRIASTRRSFAADHR
jgi:hypothetical protein